jgi:ADP-heptose:LPS heptosyltransferase
MTAAVRDLHRAHPDKYQIAVSTPCPALWENNPHIQRFEHTTTTRKQGGEDFRYPIPKDKAIQCLHCSVPLINSANALTYHYIPAMTKHLEAGLQLSIPSTHFHGDIHLSDQERSWMNQAEQETGWTGPFWILVAGGKTDITCKWWSPSFHQEVIDHFIGRIQFVQCGLKRHWHTRLKNVIDLVGQTNLRQFIRLMYHAGGVVCPVSFAMHLAAAVPTKTGAYRPCVVIAGGREPVHWEQYPGHQFLHTVGMLDCCDRGGCWKNRCQKVGDGDDKDETDLCVKPVPINPKLQIPKCMAMITPKIVINAIEGYLERGQ